MFRNRGFTLIETLIVLAIAVVLVGVVVSAFLGLNKSQAVDNDVRLIATTLDRARSNTLSSINAVQYGVHFTSTTVTIFSGSTYSSTASDNVVYSLSNATTITKSLAGTGSDIIFTRLTGETSNTGTITVTSGSTTKTITVFGTGATSVQ